MTIVENGLKNSVSGARKNAAGTRCTNTRLEELPDFTPYQYQLSHELQLVVNLRS